MDQGDTTPRLYPWQYEGSLEIPAKSPRSAARPSEPKKRKRHDRDNVSPTKKPQHHSPYTPPPPGASRAPIEVIDLIDDEDDPPPPYEPYIQHHRQASYHEPPRDPRREGSQMHPFEVDDSPPRRRHDVHINASPSSRHYTCNLDTLHPQSYDAPRVPMKPSFNLSQGELNPDEFRHAPPDDPELPTKDVVPILEPTLCPEQADLVDLILSGQNVFYTGSAGCGKSTVLKAFVKQFRERGMSVHIIAPTGRAALDINGSTTWTYAGWTPDHHKRPLKTLKAAAHGKFVQKRLKETDVLVIDEISMVENLHFERLNAVMKEARGSDLAFGGVQLIVTGDFCQLPPVKPFGHCIECGRELIKNKEETEFRCRTHGTYYDIDKWAFRSQAWKECDFKHVNLTTIHRQSDKVFIDILNNLRMGIRLKPADVDLLLNHKSETRGAIRLFATRAEVKRVNDERFRALPTTARDYHCYDNFKWNEQHGNLKNKGDRGPDGTLLSLKEHRFEPFVQLKKGMLVVLLHNLDIHSGLVNGSQGTIQGFEDYDPKKMPKAATNRQNNESDYLPGIPVLQGDHAAYREEQLKLYAKQMKYKGWPIVRFLNGVSRTIYADCTVNELGDESPHSLLSRTQVPLLAAWAMTTHKSQGMTLNRVVVDLSKSFEQGQAYVALSRARSLDGLKVESFPPSAQGSGNSQVKEFLREKFGIGA